MSKVKREMNFWQSFISAVVGEAVYLTAKNAGERRGAQRVIKFG
jgi:hypothetical protein